MMDDGREDCTMWRSWWFWSVFAVFMAAEAAAIVWFVTQ